MDKINVPIELPQQHQYVVDTYEPLGSSLSGGVIKFNTEFRVNKTSEKAGESWFEDFKKTSCLSLKKAQGPSSSSSKNEFKVYLPTDMGVFTCWQIYVEERNERE